jgi:putative DNA primase/helicase
MSGRKELPPPLQLVLNRLEGIEERGGLEFAARCPAHDDERPSLSVSWGDKSAVVLYCHAGCEQDDVVKALGLTYASLSAKQSEEAVYPYTDEEDVLLYEVVRYRDPKTFKQRRPDPDKRGRYIWSVKGITPVPYRLAELAEELMCGTDVWIVEGEKDVEALIQGVGEGMVATCNHGGAGKWSDEHHSVHFKGSSSRVTIVADRDVSGYRHARSVRDSLQRVAGITARVVHAKVGKDAAEHISDHGLEDFIELLPEALDAECGSATGADTADEAWTELGNAERFVAENHDDVRWLSETKRWAVWTGKVWENDEREQVVERAKRSIRSIRAVASALPDEAQKEALRWAKQSESARVIRATLELARSTPGLTMLTREFDVNPMLLNCQNGTLNLVTGELQPHRREDYCRKVVHVDYDPAARAPEFEAFLARVQPDPEVRSFLQRAVGYSLTGSTAEQKLILAHGNGANGKSTLIELIRDLMASYASSLPADSLAAKHSGGIPNDIARLDGARFVSVMEFENHAAINERLIKQLTGGDMLQARFMRGEFFDFRPQATIWISSNHRPVVKETDDGIWRRFLLVDFPVRIADEDIDRDLGRRLTERELPGVLRWAVEGAVAWQKQGLNPPKSILDATEAYRAESDLFGAFVEEVCVLDSEETVAKDQLFDTWAEWCQRGRVQAGSKIAFGRKVRERAEEFGLGEARIGKAKVHTWTGLGVAEAGSIRRLNRRLGLVSEPEKRAADPSG